MVARMVTRIVVRREKQMTLRIYDDLDQARQTILQRREMMALDKAPEPVRAGIRRIFGEELSPEAAVARILADVRQRGDDALRDWTDRIDGLTLDDFEVPTGELEAAYNALPTDLSAALALSSERIRAFHARQPISALSWTTTDMGGTLGQRVLRVRSAGGGAFLSHHSAVSRGLRHLRRVGLENGPQIDKGPRGLGARTAGGSRLLAPRRPAGSGDYLRPGGERAAASHNRGLPALRG